MVANEDLSQIAKGFDQQAATVITARQAVNNLIGQEPMDVIRWVDRMLIKLINRFADYKKDLQSSFKLSNEFSLFP